MGQEEVGLGVSRVFWNSDGVCGGCSEGQSLSLSKKVKGTCSGEASVSGLQMLCSEAVK